MNSILTTIKKIIGLAEDYTQFDPDIIVHTNGVLMSLTQLGIGPKEGFVITGYDEEWDMLIPNETPVRAEWIKSYVALKVRMAFDPPSGQSLIQSYERQITEYEWRLNTAAESEV